MRRIIASTLFVVSTVAGQAYAASVSPFCLPWMNASEKGAEFCTSNHSEGVFVVETYQLRCGYCDQNVSNVEALAAAYADDERVQVLDLGIDRSARDYSLWIQKHKPNHPVLMDQNRAVWSELGARGTPTAYVLDCNLNVRWSHVGVWSGSAKQSLRSTIDQLLEEGCN